MVIRPRGGRRRSLKRRQSVLWDRATGSFDRHLLPRLVSGLDQRLPIIRLATHMERKFILLSRPRLIDTIDGFGRSISVPGDFDSSPPRYRQALDPYCRDGSSFGDPPRWPLPMALPDNRANTWLSPPRISAGCTGRHGAGRISGATRLALSPGPAGHESRQSAPRDLASFD
jgi:hypothetical protein